jgi:RNA polymerase sigma-70 factor, ECF subfamily
MESPDRESGDVTLLLREPAEGNKEAECRLIPLVYDELKRLASYKLRRERPGHTLQPTALVNEAFLKLFQQRDVQWEGRTHFVALATELMRRILVDHARRRKRLKRGGDQDSLPLDEYLISEQQSEEILTLDIALNRLAKKEPRQMCVVELRYFGGLSLEETAAVLDVSPKTVHRDWLVARAWLRLQNARRESPGTRRWATSTWGIPRA